jgi:hypothetical protein
MRDAYKGSVDAAFERSGVQDGSERFRQAKLNQPYKLVAKGHEMTGAT